LSVSDVYDKELCPDEMLGPQRKKLNPHRNPQNHHPHHDEQAGVALWQTFYRKMRAVAGLLPQIHDSDDDEGDQMQLFPPFELLHLGV